MSVTESPLLEALLNSWDRNNVITRNLLLAIPEDALSLRAAPGSPTILELFGHMIYCRLIFVQEDAPEHARPINRAEWSEERDRTVLARRLDESGAAMREAVRGRLAEGRAMDYHYDHPILMLQHFIWHEGYHHGQVKIALKQAGMALDDEEIGAVTWDVWMEKKAAPEA